MRNTHGSWLALGTGGADLLAAPVRAGPSYPLVRLAGGWDATVRNQPGKAGKG